MAENALGVTLRLRVKREAYPWLRAASVEVNQAWNWANQVSADASDRNKRSSARFLSGYDLCKLAAGASACFEKISSDTIQRVCGEYATARKAARRRRLRWRISRGARRSLGWIPFKGASIKRAGSAVRYNGKAFRLFEAARLHGEKLCAGCFAEDACGDWYLCVFVRVATAAAAPERNAVGIDLGCKDAAVTSDGQRLESGHYRRLERKIAQAQRRGHKRQAKRLHRKAARQRADAQHKFSRMLVSSYGQIFVGDVSSTKLVKTRIAKSVLDAAWSQLKNQLAYKSEHAGRQFLVVNESYTSRTCSACGSLSGPKGVNGLRVRTWACVDCGESHDRDVNAARLIRIRGEASSSVCGNELVRQKAAA